MKNLISRLSKISFRFTKPKDKISPSRSILIGKTPKEIFTLIFENNLWCGEKSVSGPGSDIAQTQTIIIELRKLIDKFKIKSILDLPCGDFMWMRSVNLSGVNYLGADIVNRLIERNSKAYSSNNIKFKVNNLIKDQLPKCDIVICRDCLVHFSFEDIYSSLQNIKSSGCKYLLTTSFVEYHGNYNITTGDWRRINLQEEPFNFPNPIEVLNENCTENNGVYCDKSLLLFLIEDIKISVTI